MKSIKPSWKSISNIRKDDIFICYCPERVIPGNIFSEFINNDRIIGGINHKSAVEGENFYKTFCKGKLIKTNSTGLTIYNPSNLANLIKGMKNKNVSREDKIKARLEYEKQSVN